MCGGLSRQMMPFSPLLVADKASHSSRFCLHMLANVTLWDRFNGGTDGIACIHTFPVYPKWE